MARLCFSIALALRNQSDFIRTYFRTMPLGVQIAENLLEVQARDAKEQAKVQEKEMRVGIQVAQKNADKNLKKKSVLAPGMDPALVGVPDADIDAEKSQMQEELEQLIQKQQDAQNSFRIKKRQQALTQTLAHGLAGRYHLSKKPSHPFFEFFPENDTLTAPHT